jgi:hypothetical protein
MKTDFLVNKKEKEDMKKLLDYIVSPSEFESFIKGLQEVPSKVTVNLTAGDVDDEDYSLDDVIDISDERMRVYHFSKGDTLHISNPETLVEEEDGHIVRAPVAAGGSVYNTFYINKPWQYIAVYSKAEATNDKEEK